MRADAVKGGSGPLSLITGASAGIGAELARGLLGRGHRVIGVARRAERLAELGDAHPGFMPHPGDLLLAEDRASLVAGTLERVGAPDYLILNAGLAHYGRLEKITAAQVAEQVTLNLLAVIDLTQGFLPAMVARGRGRILIVSSVLGVGAIPYAATYCATKHGVNGFVQALRIDLKGTGVTASALCPSGVETEFRQVATGEAEPEALAQEPVERVAAGMIARLDADRAVIYPTLQSAVLGRTMATFPGLMERILVRKRPTYASVLPDGRV